MAASAKVTIGLKTTELEQIAQDFIKRFTITATPARSFHQILVQATADVAEVLPVGDVGVVELIVMFCSSNDVDIDTTYVSSFNAEIECQENEWVVFKPKGTTWIMNDDSSEQSSIEYWVLGTA